MNILKVDKLFFCLLLLAIFRRKNNCQLLDSYLNNSFEASLFIEDWWLSCHISYAPKSLYPILTKFEMNF